MAADTCSVRSSWWRDRVVTMTELFRREAVHHAMRRLTGEVVLASPVSVKTLGLLLAGILFTALVFATQASYARKVTVAGLLIPDQGMIRSTIQAVGMLQSILVREGDRVERGQRIAVVDIAAETAGGNFGTVTIRGLESETAAAQAKAQATLSRLAVERQQSKIRLDKARIDLAQAHTQLELQQQRLQLARLELMRGEEVAARGYLSQRDLASRRTTALQAEQELAIHRRQIAMAEKEIADIEARITSIPHEMRVTEAELQTATATIQQRAADVEQRRSQFVVAPITGRIAALPVSTGQFIAAGVTIAVLIPEGSQLEAELLAPSRSIGFIKPGQEVQLRLQAFPYQRFGTVKGAIRTVSTTVLAPNEVGVQGLAIEEPVYRIRVTMSREAIYAYGEVVPMQPGMLVSAEIIVDRRSLMQWLFDPIYAVSRRS
jgi:membrane fusion protein